jgi:hypothetical protein
MKGVSASMGAPPIRLNLKSGGGTTGDPILIKESGRSAEFTIPNERQMWKDF